LEKFERQTPEGKKFLGFVLRRGTNELNEETYFPDALYSANGQVNKDKALNMIVKREDPKTPLCPYPPGY